MHGGPGSTHAVAPHHLVSGWTAAAVSVHRETVRNAHQAEVTNPPSLLPDGAPTVGNIGGRADAPEKPRHGWQRHPSATREALKDAPTLYGKLATVDHKTMSKAPQSSPCLSGGNPSSCRIGRTRAAGSRSGDRRGRIDNGALHGKQTAKRLVAMGALEQRPKSPCLMRLLTLDKHQLPTMIPSDDS